MTSLHATPSGGKAAAKSALSVSGLKKRFGGLTAVDDVSVDFESGRLHAIIGPNGAGKTTFFNLVSGFLTADTGEIRFGDLRIDGLQTHQVAQTGIVRTLQIKSVFNALSVRENIHVAAQSQGRYLDPVRGWRADHEARRTVERVIDEMQLGAIANQQAGTLSYGDVALLEIGMALAKSPKLLLLDEPICGMSPEETERSVAKIVELSKSIDVVLVEHDMDVVFEIADMITVMAQGKVLMRGTPAAVRSNAEVREAYLGAED